MTFHEHTQVESIFITLGLKAFNYIVLKNV